MLGDSCKETLGVKYSLFLLTFSLEQLFDVEVFQCQIVLICIVFVGHVTIPLFLPSILDVVQGLENV